MVVLVCLTRKRKSLFDRVKCHGVDTETKLNLQGHNEVWGIRDQRGGIGDQRGGIGDQIACSRLRDSGKRN